MTFKYSLVGMLCLILFLVLYRSYSDDTNTSTLKLSDQFISADGGNDVMVFTPALGETKWKYLDAGPGIDTLWLRLTNSDIQNPKIQADILRFYYFLMNNSESESSYKQGSEFVFSAFPLTLRNFENIIVEKIPLINNKSETLINPPSHIIRDSSIDSSS